MEENEVSEEQMMEYPLTTEECYPPEEEKDRKGKTWGKNILQDPTHSGIGEKIHELMQNKPPFSQKWHYEKWVTEVKELTQKYNVLCRFDAFGNEIE